MDNRPFQRCRGSILVIKVKRIEVTGQCGELPDIVRRYRAPERCPIPDLDFVEAKIRSDIS